MRPAREVARNNSQTYFVTFQTAGRKPFFRNERWAVLFMDILKRYADATEYYLHDFVIMSDHAHLLITPCGALERSVQLIKGSFSFHAKRSFAWKSDVWQIGFTDHRIRDMEDWDHHIAYVEKNVRSLDLEGYKFCGRAEGIPLAPRPVWLGSRDNQS